MINDTVTLMKSDFGLLGMGALGGEKTVLGGINCRFGLQTLGGNITNEEVNPSSQDASPLIFQTPLEVVFERAWRGPPEGPCRTLPPRPVNKYHLMMML